MKARRLPGSIGFNRVVLSGRESVKTGSPARKARNYAAGSRTCQAKQAANQQALGRPDDSLEGHTPQTRMRRTARGACIRAPESHCGPQRPDRSRRCPAAAAGRRRSRRRRHTSPAQGLEGVYANQPPAQVTLRSSVVLILNQERSLRASRYSGASAPASSRPTFNPWMPHSA